MLCHALLIGGLTLATFGFPLLSVASDSCTDRKIIDHFNHRERGDIPIWRAGKDAIGFASIMHVNADGAPNAYNKEDTGLSYICDGSIAYSPTKRRCVAPGEPGWQQLCKRAFQEALKEEFHGPAQMCTFGFLAEGGRKIGSYTVGDRKSVV